MSPPCQLTNQAWSAALRSPPLFRPPFSSLFWPLHSPLCPEILGTATGNKRAHCVGQACWPAWVGHVHCPPVNVLVSTGTRSSQHGTRCVSVLPWRNRSWHWFWDTCHTPVWSGHEHMYLNCHSVRCPPSQPWAQCNHLGTASNHAYPLLNLHPTKTGNSLGHERTLIKTEIIGYF